VYGRIWLLQAGHMIPVVYIADAAAADWASTPKEVIDGDVFVRNATLLHCAAVAKHRPPGISEHSGYSQARGGTSQPTPHTPSCTFEQLCLLSHSISVSLFSASALLSLALAHTPQHTRTTSSDTAGRR
jgi:hypothetical protein